jgi:hypothetical protein
MIKTAELKDSLIKLAEKMEEYVAQIESEPTTKQEKIASTKPVNDFDFGKVSTTSKTASTNPMLDFLMS